jgi:hypothetical protein
MSLALDVTLDDVCVQVCRSYATRLERLTAHRPTRRCFAG